MVKLTTKITDSGVLYVPKTIRENFGRNMNIITDASAVIMYPEGLDYEDLLTSLDILKADVQQRISLRNKKDGRSPL
jgi:hypothetical protein